MEKRSGQAPNVPASRFTIDAPFHTNNDRPGSFGVLGGYFINETLQEFDPGFFGITPVEATWMEPQQRKLLEVVYEALKSAGLTLDQLTGSDTACFMATFTADFQQMSFKEPSFRHSLAATAVDPGLLSNRVSHVFNLRGPSIVVNTACSSSVYVLHIACNAPRTHECSAAVLRQRLRSAEGVGAIYLKRLSDSVRDGDPIRGVIRSSATKNNGKAAGVGITYTGFDGQRNFMRHAYRRSGLDPMLIGYFECHGTGTAIGDPLEVHAVFYIMNSIRTDADGALNIGVIKTNIGYSGAASGLSAIIKAILMAERGIIPPTHGVTGLNPKIDWKGWKVHMPTEPTPMPRHLPVMRLSVNYFGYGGTNAHTIVESPKSLLSMPQNYKYSMHGHCVKTKLARGAVNRSRPYLLVFWAYDTGALKRNPIAHGKVAAKYNLLDISFTIANHRTRFQSKGMPMTLYPTFLKAIRRMDLILEDLEDAPSWTLEECPLENPATSRVGEAEFRSFFAPLFRSLWHTIRTTCSQQWTEIDPSSALSGPIRQIKTHLSTDKVQYIPTLIRDARCAEQVLKLAGELFLRDYPIDLQRITAIEEFSPSGKITSRQAKKFWAESCESKEHRSPRFPRHRILGQLTTVGPLKEPSGRNVLRLKDLSWLRDHSLGEEAVFPAADYLSMTMEAITELNKMSEAPLDIDSYIFRDISIQQALATPDDNDGIETLFNMRTSRLSTDETRKWWDFNTSSVPTEGHVKNHMAGRICINTNKGRALAKTVPNLPKRASGKLWNQALKKLGFNYGPTFQDLDNITFDGSHTVLSQIVSGPDFLLRSQSHLSLTDFIELAQFKKPPLKVLVSGPAPATAILARLPELYLTVAIDPSHISDASAELSKFTNTSVEPLVLAADLTTQTQGKLKCSFDIIATLSTSLHELQNISELLSGDGCAMLGGDMSALTEKRLRDVGLSGFESFLGESLFVTRIEKTSNPTAAPIWLLFHSDLPRCVYDLERGLKRLGFETERLRLGNACLAGANVIALVDLEGPPMANMSEDEFLHIQKILSDASKVLWMSCSDTADDVPNPEYAMTAGLQRSLRSERASLKATLVDLSIDHLASDGLGTRTLRLASVYFTDEQELETEYVSKDGQLLINQLVPFNRINEAYALIDEETWSQPFDPEARLVGAIDSGKVVFSHCNADEVALQLTEVEFRVIATGLTDEDKAVILGYSPGPEFSYEASGIMTQTGDAVRCKGIAQRPYRGKVDISCVEDV
ncbi:polyketide synthase [Fusarium mundagurra]|uniref:Polyketide synthase n=1 Tax=Fusarium mundagurra TaxID=1567541 RepID=A0A8H5XRQ3_9HYPO|nr:polyketide synthase [Fusarium mundagurra]